jgi:hypothetical protein
MSILASVELASLTSVQQDVGTLPQTACMPQCMSASKHVGVLDGFLRSSPLTGETAGQHT